MPRLPRRRRTARRAKPRRSSRFRRLACEPLEPRRLLALLSTGAVRDRLDDVNISGVTVITHGFAPTSGDYMQEVATSLHNRFPSYVLDYDIRAGGSQGYEVTNPRIASSSYEAIVLWDWAPLTRVATPGMGEAGGDGLFAGLVGLGLVDPAAGAANPPLHFIAHSFGTAAASEAVERLAAHSVPVDHVTYLDPHDFNQPAPLNGIGLDIDGDHQLWQLGQPGGSGATTQTGYGVTVWDNVAFADNYYQTRGDSEGWLRYINLPHGRPIPGAANYYFSDAYLEQVASPDDHRYPWNPLYIDSINDPASESFGFRFARLAGAGGRVSRSTLAAGTTNASFYAAAHDHVWSSQSLVRGVFGNDGRTGVQTGQTATTINAARWAPRWDPIDDAVHNGDFSQGGFTAAPGWFHYGAESAVITGGRAIVTDRVPELTHSAFYVPSSGPNDQLQLQFDTKRTGGDGKYELKVFLDSEDGRRGNFHVATLDLDRTDASSTTRVFDIPQRYENQAARLRFAVARKSLFSLLNLTRHEVEIDNVRLTTRSTPQIDLVPQPIGNVATPVAVGGRLDIPTDIRNPATAASGPYVIEYRASRDQDFENEYVVLDRQHVTSLDAGGRRTWTPAVPIPSDIAAGEYYVGYVLDPEDLIPELNDSPRDNTAIADNRVTVSSEPDMTVTQVGVDGTILLGKQFNVRTQIENIGVATSDVTVVRYLLSSDTTIGNADDVLLAHDVQDVLEPGGSIDWSFGLQATDARITTGTWRVGVVLDPAGNSPDSDRTNNSRLSDPVQIVDPPSVDVDLRGALFHPLTTVAAAGGSLTVNAVVRNDGGAASGAYAVEFRLSRNPDVNDGRDDVVLGRATRPALGAGSVDDWPQSLTIPAGTPAGDYFIGGVVDPDGLLADSNRVNNEFVSRTLTVTATPPAQKPDLAVTAVDGPESSLRGQSISVATTVENIGAAASPGYEIEYFLSADKIPGPDDLNLTPTPIDRPAIAAASSSSWQQSLAIPAGTAPGTYYLIAIANLNRRFDEYRIINNVGRDPHAIRVLESLPVADRGFQYPLGDLRSGRFISQQFNGNATGSDGVTRIGHLGTDIPGRVGETVSSIGGGVVTFAGYAGPGWGNVVIVRHDTKSWGWTKNVYSLYGHVDPLVGVGTPVDRGQPVAKIAPTAAGSTGPHLHLEVRSGEDAGDQAGPGYHQGRVTVESANNYRIRGYRHDIVWHDPVVVIGGNLPPEPPAADRVDLQPTQVRGPQQAAVGSTVRVFTRIRNNGSVGNSNFQVQFVISRNRQVSRGDQPLGAPVTRGTISPGSENGFWTNLTLPSDLVPGRRYWIGAVVDPTNQIAEYNDQNNALASAPFTARAAAPAAKADLVGTRLELAPALSDYAWGQRVRVSYAVKNTGTAAAAATTVRFVLADDPRRPGFTADVATRAMKPIGVGRTASAIAGFDLPTSPPAGYNGGPLYLLMVVDADDNVDELTENNNAGQGRGEDWLEIPRANFNDPSDVRGEHLMIRPFRRAYEWGEQIDVVFSFVNQGRGASLPFEYEFYLSSNPVVSRNDYWISTRAFGRLDPGERYTETVPVYLPTSPPAGLASGPLYLGVVIDPDRQLNDSNRGNDRGQGTAIDVLPLTIVPPPPLASGPEPEIGSFTAQPGSVIRGQKVTLIARDVIDDKNAVNEVVFRLDTNDNNRFDASDLYLAHGSKEGTVFSATVTTNASWANGDNRVLARAKDNHGLVSGTESATVNVSGVDPGPFPDDSLENNDTFNTATFLGGGILHTLSDLALTAGDVDYYMFELTGDATQLDVQINFTQDAGAGIVGDLTLEVQRIFGSQLVHVGFSNTSSAGNTQERVTRASSGTGTLANGRYLARVAGQGAAERNPDYDLSITITPKAGAPVAGDLSASAARLVQGETITLSMDDDGITGIAAADIDGVHFYNDRNRDGRLDITREYLGSDWGSGDGPQGQYTVEVSTDDWALGDNRLMAFVSKKNGPASMVEYAAVELLENRPPDIGSLEAPASAIQGGAVTLTARDVVEPDLGGQVTSVAFFLDSNHNQQHDTDDSLLGEGTKNAANNDWTLTVDTFEWPLGTNGLFVIATDQLGLASAPSTDSLELIRSDNAAPRIESFLSPEGVLKGNVLTLVGGNVTDPNNDSLTVTFLHDANGNNGLDPSDPVVGTVTRAGSDYTGTIDTSQLIHGVNRFFAKVVDNGTPPLQEVATLTVLVSDLSGPQLINVTPDQPIEGSFDSVRVEFDEPIEVGTFTTDDVGPLQGPDGSVNADSVQEVDGSGGRQFDIFFARRTAPGAYQLNVGPNIVDLAGNVMDQDADGTGGESSDDVARMDFEIIAPPADFVWTRSFGGSGTDISFDMTVDSQGNSYLVGQFTGTIDFDPSPQATRNITSTGGRDIFVAKYNADGDHVWSTSFVGTPVMKCLAESTWTRPETCTWSASCPVP